MADRTQGALPTPTWRGILDALRRRLSDLEARVRGLESRSGQTLPPDYRFTTNDDGELVIRRVSTGDERVIDV